MTAARSARSNSPLVAKGEESGLRLMPNVSRVMGLPFGVRWVLSRVSATRLTFTWRGLTGKRRNVVKTNQIDVVARTVLRYFKEINHA